MHKAMSISIKLSIEHRNYVSNMLQHQYDLNAKKNIKSLEYKNLINNFTFQKARKMTIVYTYMNSSYESAGFTLT